MMSRLEFEAKAHARALRLWADPPELREAVLELAEQRMRANVTVGYEYLIDNVFDAVRRHLAALDAGVGAGHA